jgi:hypothetical protein
VKRTFTSKLLKLLGTQTKTPAGRRDFCRLLRAVRFD